jgi:hypothetical protein
MFPIIPANSAAAGERNQEGIFGFGSDGGASDITNKVSNTGVVAADVSGVGTSRYDPAGCEYGEDKAIIGFGYDGNPNVTNVTNLVSNTGVVASDQAATTGTARSMLAACSFGGDGGDQGIFGFGYPASIGSDITNLVSNAGVVAADVSGVGTSRQALAACEYGDDKAIFGFGTSTGSNNLSLTNLVSNAGVVASDQAATTGSARRYLAACSFGGDQGIFGYGYISGRVSMTNKVSNAGVVAADVAGVGTDVNSLAACEFGGDQAIFGFGLTTGGAMTSLTNLVSNTGVVSSDQAATTGTANGSRAGCSFN